MVDTIHGIRLCDDYIERVKTQPLFTFPQLIRQFKVFCQLLPREEDSPKIHFSRDLSFIFIGPRL